MTDVLVIIVQALIVLVFANRVLGRLWVWAFRSSEKDRAPADFQPTVTVVVPLYNEGESIRATIRSLLAQDYPQDKLGVIVVDDCSTDGSFLHACREARQSNRVRVLRNERNMGKRRSINRAVREADSEIIVSVDSDVLVEPDAIRLLVSGFSSEKIAAVGGRVDVDNKHDNWLTRMQTVKYFYSYYFMKGLEPALKSVMCLSGCLTAYRRSVLIELEPILEQRAIMGLPIKYGEDRFLTRQIIKAGYKTGMTLDAVCKTKVPTDLDRYFAQQLRWRRSNIVDYIGGLSHVWRQHPAIAINYFSSFAMMLVYPVLLAHALFTGWLPLLLVAQLGITAVMGVIYGVMSRKRPAHERVGAANALWMSVTNPVAYCVLFPLALFTLDSGCWETRGHVDTEAAPEPQPAAAEPAKESKPLAPVLDLSESRLRAAYGGVMKAAREPAVESRRRTSALP